MLKETEIDRVLIEKEVAERHLADVWQQCKPPV
jgi:hypothetical protein